MTDKKTGSYDTTEIQKRIPHRYPLLMVDFIEESGYTYAIGIKNVSINEPYFQGHFPDEPIMPCVLITESILQTSAFIGIPEQDDKSVDIGPKKQFFCVGFNMKFKLPVVPGDRLRIEVRLVRHMGEMTRVKAVVQSDKGVNASGDLSLAVINKRRSQ